MSTPIYDILHPSLVDAFFFEEIGIQGQVYGEKGVLSGSVYGGVSIQPAEFGNLVQTNGSDGYVAIELGQIPAQYSISAWIREDYDSKPDDALSVGRPSSGNANRYGIMLGYYSYQDYFGYGSGWCGAPVYPEMAGLHHAVWVIDNINKEVRKYINKQLVYDVSLSRAISYSGTKLHIGAGAWANSHPKVDVDDLRIFNKLLDAAEVAQLHDYVFPYEVAGLVELNSTPHQTGVSIYRAAGGDRIARVTTGPDGRYNHILKTADPVIVMPDTPSGYKPMAHGPITPAPRNP